ncbi:hypothetical protein [Treponema sp.]|uniref:hypothetical protein n=1 Tax=Treponema sp. TaxID=166 RepID=UPI003FD708B6
MSKKHKRKLLISKKLKVFLLDLLREASIAITISAGTLLYFLDLPVEYNSFKD